MRNLHAGESLLIAFALYTSVAGLFFTYESVTYFVYQVLIRIGDLLALYFVTRACITRKEHVLWILTALVAMGFLYSWMGFYDHFTGRMSLTALIGVKAGLVYGDVGGRAAGPFLSPAHLGMFMGMAALVAVHLAVSQRNTVVKLLLYAAAVPMIFAWFWTYTRGGYLLLLVGLALMPFFAVSTRRAYALILGVLVAVGVVVVPFAMTNKDVENRLTNEGTARSRIVAGNALINLVKHHPLFGVGVGNGNKEMIKYVTSVGAAPGLLIWEGMGSWPKRFELPEHTSSHSTYLTILADHGVIGGVLFFGALAALLVRMWRTRRVLPYSGPLGRDIAALLVAITVGYALSINTTRVEQSEYISLVAWLLVASLIQLGEIVRKESREPAVTDAEPDESSRVRVLAGGRS